jgi:putative sterol carrier protein
VNYINIFMVDRYREAISINHKNEDKKMAYAFPSDAWVKAMMADLNQSPTYKKAAEKWEGDFFFIIEPGGGLEKPITLYMDLWHGECREACEVEENERTPVFRLSGPVAIWKKVMTRKLDPMQALVTGQLRLSGNMAMVMKNVRAAKELVDACARIATDFPL